MGLATFKLFDADAFVSYLKSTSFQRTVRVIQNHHTWKPSYANLTPARDEMYWLEAMRRSHIQDRKWSDIGQHITTFPSGKIALCRPIDKTPAGIFGANTGAICIEHFGNFDKGGDQMTEVHKQTIITLNAALCMAFNLQPVAWQIVYHHWYDTSGKPFSANLINSGGVGTMQKSCPGTEFFGGNTITAAQAHFFPEIANALQLLKNGPQAPPPPPRFRVNADALNVRSGPAKTFPVVRVLPRGSEVQGFELNTGGWHRISNTAQEWASATFLTAI